MRSSYRAADAAEAPQDGGFVLAGSKRRVEVKNPDNARATRVRAVLNADLGGLLRAGGRGGHGAPQHGASQQEDARTERGGGDCQSLDSGDGRHGSDYDGNPLRKSVRSLSGSQLLRVASPLHAHGRSCELPGLPGIAGNGHTPARPPQQQGSGCAAPSSAMRMGLNALSALGVAHTPARQGLDSRRQQPVPSSPYPSTPCPSDTSLGTPITNQRTASKHFSSGASFIPPATQTQVADISASFSSTLLSQPPAAHAPRQQQKPTPPSSFSSQRPFQPSQAPPPPKPQQPQHQPSPPQQQHQPRLPQPQPQAQLQAQRQPGRMMQARLFVPASPPPGTPPPEIEAEMLQEAAELAQQQEEQYLLEHYHWQEEVAHDPSNPGSPPQGDGPSSSSNEVGARAREGGSGANAPASTGVKESSSWDHGGGMRDFENGGARRDGQKEHHVHLRTDYVKKCIPPLSLAGGRRSESNGSGGSRPSTSAQNGAPDQNLWPRLNLPQNCVSIFQRRGIKQPWPWQVDCLTSDPLRHDQNFMFCLPTSAGKTFVSEVLILKKMLQYKRTRRRFWDNSVVPCKCMIVFPYVSLCEEKKTDFVELGDELGFAVEFFYDHMGKFPLMPRAQQLYVATIEKAERIVTTLLEEGRAGELGLVVVDELHFVGENSRGCILETMLTRLKTLVPKCQLVGMSATLPNLSDVEQWLKAHRFDGTMTKRPIELLEHVVFHRQLIHKKDVADETLELSPGHDVLTHLVMEGIAGHHGDGNGSVLVFCPTVKETETVAAKLQHALRNGQPTRRIVDAGELLVRRSDLAHHMRNIKGGTTSPDLMTKLVEAGIAFHNSRLLREERKMIEDAFKEGVLQVIVSTSTLAAGVNLPAGTVVITRPRLGMDPLKPSTYKQMAGRAGRTAYAGDTGYENGRSFLIALNEKERDFARELMEQGPQEVRSQLMAPCERGWGDKKRSAPLTKAQEINPGTVKAAHSSTGQRRAKEHPDEFMRAVLSFVCTGRLPPNTANVQGGGPQASSGGMGCDGVEVSTVQKFINATFFGVVWARLLRETQKIPDADTMHLPPPSANGSVVSSAMLCAITCKVGVSSRAKETVDTLEDMVEEVLLWLEEKNLIVTRGHTDLSMAECVDAAAGAAGAPNADVACGSSSAANSTGGTKIGGNRLHPTGLGRATYLSCLPIKVAMEVYLDMSRGRNEGVVLGDMLHLLFMLTPVDQFAQRFLEDDAFWPLLARRIEHEFDETRNRVLERIGLNFAWVQRRSLPTVQKGGEVFKDQDRKGKRLWLALILQDLVEEQPVGAVIAKYAPARSEAPDSKRLTAKELQDLQSAGAMFAGKVAQFAHNVGFEDLGVLFHHFIGRIAFGARADVLPLCEIPWIQVARARILYQQGIKTVEHVAGESSERLAHILDIKPKNSAKRLAQKIIDAAREICTRRVADQQLLLQSSVFAAGTSD